METSEAWEVTELIIYIGSRKMLRLERWRDEYKDWRGGIEWYSATQFEYVVEKKTLLEVLRDIRRFIDEQPGQGRIPPALEASKRK